jgi:ribonuclease Z
MPENLPVRTLRFDGLTIEGYSRAAVQSYFRIPELKIGFDMGGSPWDFMGTPTIFITHAHLDHMAALPAFVARRRMMKMDPPTIYLPEEVVDNTRRMLDSWHRLDRGRMVCDLIGVKDGQEIRLGRENVVTVFKTKHTVPSVGYLVWNRRNKLKPEYRELSGEQIRDIRLAGTEVSEEIRHPRLCYVGDTAPAGLDRYPAIYDADVLITELTYFRPEHRLEKIHKFGHTHIDDLVERADRFNNKLIIGTHASTRYHEREIRRAIQKRFPAALKERFKLWL